MNAVDNGKYRMRKDWASVSIPSLVDIDEHEDDENENVLNTTEPIMQPTQKPTRRSSLALAFFSNKSDKSQKRRSSIAVTFFRRDKRENNRKDSSYENTVKQEKSDGSVPEVTFSSDENLKASGQNDVGNEKERSRRRRSSLQAKLDRRRRKNFDSNILTPDNSPTEETFDMSIDGNGMRKRTISNGEYDSNDQAHFYSRQKRNSWWNIFVPDNLKQRSRRASQDVNLMSRSFDNLSVPVRRSKSRSVDHGLAAPFDLDSLRSKVEGRFESVDRLTNERKKPPVPTLTYTVGNRDTLTSVAARFDTTPSELTGLNRLNSSFIYPGQQLLVPDKNAKDNASTSSSSEERGSGGSGKSSPVDRKMSTTADDDEKDILEGLRPGSPKPGHIERVDAQIYADDDKKGDDPVITQRFLKINVRHITDGQGVVGGVLLVTPNAVMFDPNVSDTLVIEHGPESYGVIAPMDLVVNAAIFHDIAHMRVASGAIGSTANSNPEDKPEIYYPKAVLEAQQANNPQGSQKHLNVGSVETCDDQESICSGTGRDGDAFPKAFDRERVEDVEKCTEAKENESGKTDKKENNEDDEENDNAKSKLNITDTRTTLEERRKSLLDHHWAIPSKDRSSEDEGDNESNTTIDSGARGQDPHSATSSLSGVVGAAAAEIVMPPTIDLEHLEQLSKQSCYDSGIDIREAIPNVQPIPKKTVYSDADIVLSSDWVPPKTISPTNFSESPSRSTLPGSGLDAGIPTRKKTSSVSFSVDDNVPSENAPNTIQQPATDKSAEKKNKMLKRLSYPLTWVEGLTGDPAGPPSAGGIGNKSTENDSAPNTADSNQSVFSKVFSRRSSIGTFMRPHSSEGTSSTNKVKDNKPQQPKLDYRSMVSVDDKPELFISVDKLIPRPALACPDPPLYLRLRMGKPIGKAIPLPTSVMSYGKNKLRPEYWFSVPKNRVDELYRFIKTWVPHLYGELDEEQIKERGFELIQDDTEWTKSGTNKSGANAGSQENEEIGDLTRESWEVLSMSTDEYRKASLFQTGSFDLDFPIPDLIGTTEILTEEHREKICGHLPARAEGYSWSLVFSTSQHGFSINSLYRKMQRLESPVLIVIEDTDNNVFGALTSCSLHVSDHFYGTGESLLYKFNPNFKVFHWTGENLYFIKGNVESLSIGAGDGRFGLWLDGDLNQGRSQSCSTYGNEPLAPREDFVVKTLECWAFV